MFSDHTQKLQFYGHCSCRRLLGQKAWCRTTNWNNVSRQYFQQKHITWKHYLSLRIFFRRVEARGLKTKLLIDY
ncbi:hypothetical protein Gasu_16340 isoform 2 [Galdieria sulphuraria]|uniref:Uncharacterized protein n=1 Tax=Galdieria sulphuraria TaxID=130081 RepID=M2Y591_GALSU|nr:hypothetical protein Gasu_16340 isoform 2 [Galdieria sulphuraria]EME31138.1 hypothetical protein isoform 2 [Galdieria sulphuraria]|eukprot:XP_005707658.1 hypothetical protein isoform 2 [Galdieria sulphuraria]